LFTAVDCFHFSRVAAYLPWMAQPSDPECGKVPLIRSFQQIDRCPCFTPKFTPPIGESQIAHFAAVAGGIKGSRLLYTQ
jgi:hypothetical protein